MPADQNRDETAAEKLFIEQARAYGHDLRAAGENAPYGKGLQRCKAVAVLGGRELVRKSLELAAQENIERLEKKRKSDHATAEENETIADTRKNNPSPPSE